MATLFPSLISARLLNLQQEIAQLEPYVDGYHLDIMDFHFVPNLTWGPAFVNEIRNATQKTLFIHLMVEHPEKYFDLFQLREGDIVAVHYESPSEYSMEELFRQITSYGWIPSIAVNPATNLDPVYALKNSLQNVLLMSVNPGFSGQTFMHETTEKLKDLTAWRRQQNLAFAISLDGGINETNCHRLVELGVDQIAVASGIFSNPNRVEALIHLLRSCSLD